MNSVSISNLSTVCLKCPLTRMGNSILYILKNAQDFRDIQEELGNRASVDKYRHNEFHLRQTDLLLGLSIERVPYHGSNR